ncbi:MAG: MFS transporter [Planctomycetes bacterium]|nr:MFS transporter [Planctomycetota bacterium]
MNAPVTPLAPALTPARERALVFVVAAVQFVNVLEFMIVMPLGPDFAQALGFQLDAVGYLGAAYTGAGAVAGLLGALLLDRFDRRRALVALMLGLVAATVLAGLARDLRELVAARLLAGAFGGPATSVSIAIVADLVPPARRGRAMAVVMGAFSVSSIVGVPAALELARLGGWAAPFFAVAALALLVTAFAGLALPAMTAHVAGAAVGPQGLRRLWGLVRRPEAALSLAAVGLSMVTIFLIVPNLSAYLQFNALWPRERLSVLYLFGGLASLALMTVAGRAVDRFGATPVVAFAAVCICGVVGVGILPGRPAIPTLLFFVLFMGSTSIRGVAVSALSSRVPPPDERAGYQSAQSAVQHLAGAIGALASTFVLVERPDKSLAGMEVLGACTIAGTLLVPLFARAVERRVRSREASIPPSAGSGGETEPAGP